MTFVCNVRQVMDGVIIIAAIILNPRAEKRRREGHGIMLTETLTDTTVTNVHILDTPPVTYNTSTDL